jgi:hypothetical protein
MGAITFTPTAKDLPRPNRGPGAGRYDEIEVPGDYEVKLEEWDTFDNTAKGGAKGWVFTFSCETPSGGSVPFDTHLGFGDNARWKIVEVFDACGQQSAEGVARSFDPDDIVGSVIGAHIDFPRDKTTGEATSKYREIRYVFALPDDADIVEAAENLDEPAEAVEEPIEL